MSIAFYTFIAETSESFIGILAAMFFAYRPLLKLLSRATQALEPLPKASKDFIAMRTNTSKLKSNDITSNFVILEAISANLS